MRKEWTKENEEEWKKWMKELEKTRRFWEYKEKVRSSLLEWMDKRTVIPGSIESIMIFLNQLIEMAEDRIYFASTDRSAMDVLDKVREYLSYMYEEIAKETTISHATHCTYDIKGYVIYTSNVTGFCHEESGITVTFISCRDGLLVWIDNYCPGLVHPYDITNVLKDLGVS